LGRAEAIIEECRELLEGLSFAPVERWRERNPQGKVVGHFQVYSPEEIVHAGGMLPVTIAGAGNKLEARRATSRLPSFICAICHNSLELALSGRLPFLAAMIFHPICDAARHLAGIWRRHFPHLLVEILYLPQNLPARAALPFLQEEYRRLKGDLEELCGRPIGDDELRRSIAIYNENRRLLRQLYALKRESPWLLPTADLYALMRAGTLMPKEEHNHLLREVLAALPERRARPRDKVRVVLEGAFCELPPLELIEVLEEVFYIVDDDLLLGSRFLLGDVPQEGDPLLNLALSYVQGSTYCSVQHDGRRPKTAGLLEKIRRAGAQAAILCPPKMCEPGLDDQALFAKELEGEGIPYLCLEFEEKMASFEQIRLQAETFAEALLFA